MFKVMLHLITNQSALFHLYKFVIGIGSSIHFSSWKLKLSFFSFSLILLPVWSWSWRGPRQTKTGILDSNIPASEITFVTREEKLGRYKTTSVTRLADLLDFWATFQNHGYNLFAQISYILRQFLWRCQNL